MKINGKNICIGCMKPLDLKGGCSFCGMKQEEYNPIPRCLLPGTELAGRYVLGKVLGEGSFGITYIGWDTYMDFPVAIKEYFPSEMVSRDVICGTGNSVYLYENSRKNRYDDDLKKFLNEARCLSRFNDVKGIVSVLDFFYENNTAYIVMQYIDGVSVKEYVDKNGKIPGEKVLETIEPVLLALDQVHRTGIVHRDISPDNIMIKKDGSLVLIDFGAARMRNIDNTKTMTVMFKRGFSPEEQYRYKGRWGAYTDVYSISATMYFMMTGTPPTDSVIRALGDDMPSLVSMKDLKISMRQKKAVMKGMAVSARNRWQSVGELYEALYRGDDVENLWKNRKKGKRAAVLVCLIAAVTGLVFGSTQIWKRIAGAHDTVPVTDTQAALEEIAEEDPAAQEKSKITMIHVTGLNREEAEEQLKGYTDMVEINWQKEYSNQAEKGEIISQSIPEGKILSQEEREELTLVVSRGKEKRMVPKLIGLSAKQAEKKLEKEGFKCKIKKIGSDREKGTVLAQSVPEGKKVLAGKTVTITVSKGKAAVSPTPAPKRQTSGNHSQGQNSTKNGDFAGVIQ